MSGLDYLFIIIFLGSIWVTLMWKLRSIEKLLESRSKDN